MNLPEARRRTSGESLNCRRPDIGVSAHSEGQMRKRFGRAQLRATDGWLAGVAALLLFVACHPYGDSLTGEFNAGSADPFNFPPAYRSSTGAGFSRQIAGSGTFTERRAFARGVASNYFFFPFPP